VISVILPAGGAGKRMRAGGPKVFIKLAGKPILIRALEAFRGIGGIREIVLALPPRRISKAISEFGGAFRRLGVTKIVSGGAERQESVANALAVVSSRAELVLVHDAARPLVTKKEIRAVLKAARSSGAAIVALPARDTVKQVGRGGKIERTLDRSNLWQALTPQVFKAGLLREAHAKSRGRRATDDAQLVERLGKKVVVVPGSASNIKITTREDLRLAEALLRCA
jgi:2-C-methyl-D-erythritol 4-phosphate cytidylyltransferase